MTIRCVARTALSLDTYAAVRIAFEVAEVLDLDTATPGTQTGFRTLPVAAPTVKDYDAIPGNHPSDWRRRYAVEDWLIFTAHESDRPEPSIGGIIVAGDAALLPEPTALLLWDLRVEPAFRHGGIGRRLLAAAEAAVRARGATSLYAETQDINVGACRFYARHGFVLESITREAYPELPGEARLVWKKRLRNVQALAECLGAL